MRSIGHRAARRVDDSRHRASRPPASPAPCRPLPFWLGALLSSPLSITCRRSEDRTGVAIIASHCLPLESSWAACCWSTGPSSTLDSVLSAAHQSHAAHRRPISPGARSHCVAEGSGHPATRSHQTASASHRCALQAFRGRRSGETWLLNEAVRYDRHCTQRRSQAGSTAGCDESLQGHGGGSMRADSPGSAGGQTLRPPRAVPAALPVPSPCWDPAH